MDAFAQFVGDHIVDIIISVIIGIKVLAVSKANLRVIILASLLLACAFYIGGIVSEKLGGPEASIISRLVVFIGIRLIAMKIIFTVIDWE